MLNPRNPLQLTYQHSYHRCVYQSYFQGRHFLFLLLPLLLILIMYSIMITQIIRSKIRASKMILTSTAIIVTGVVSSLPFTLLAFFNIELDYEAAQVLTVTLYYINGICNPCIYLCSNPMAKKQLRNMSVVSHFTVRNNTVSGAHG